MSDDQAPVHIWLTLDYEDRGECYYFWTAKPNGPEDIAYVRADGAERLRERIDEMEHVLGHVETCDKTCPECKRLAALALADHPESG